MPNQEWKLSQNPVESVGSSMSNLPDKELHLFLDFTFQKIENTNFLGGEGSTK